MRRPAALSLVVLAATTLHAADRLILRDGSAVSGQLRACSTENCRIGSSSVPIENILWIGIEPEKDEAPPAAPSDSIDTVILTDGTNHPGALVGVSLGEVVNERGSWDRENVQWIFLAPRPDSPPASSPGATTPPPPPPPPPATQPPPNARPRPPTNAPRPRRSPEDALKPCPAARPLGGHVEIREDGTADSRAFRRRSRIRLWFGLSTPVPMAWRYALNQPWSASHMIWKMDASACIDLPDPYNAACSCAPSRDSGVADLSKGGYAHFHPLYPELKLHFPNIVTDTGRVPYECTRPDAGSSGVIGTFLFGAENVLPVGDETRAFYVAPTGCHDANGDLIPDCGTRPDLYAVIPFAGSDQRTDAFGEDQLQTKMRWEICCGCGIPPRDMPEGETDPCGDPDQQRGLLEVAVDRANALRAEMSPRIAEFERHWGQAKQHQSDFQLVVNSCAGWDIAMALLGYLAGGPNATQSAQAFTQGLGMLQQILAQDPSVVLSAGAAFGIEGWDVVNDSWGLLSTLYGSALDASSAGSIAGMKAKLEDCARVPLVSNLVYDDARLYLQHLEQAFTELREIHRLSTQMQQADTDVINKWHAFHRSCVENARCRGMDPAICGPEPP